MLSSRDAYKHIYMKGVKKSDINMSETILLMDSILEAAMFYRDIRKVSIKLTLLSF